MSALAADQRGVMTSKRSNDDKAILGDSYQRQIDMRMDMAIDPGRGSEEAIGSLQTTPGLRPAMTETLEQAPSLSESLLSGFLESSTTIADQQLNVADGNDGGPQSRPVGKGLTDSARTRWEKSSRQKKREAINHEDKCTRQGRMVAGPGNGSLR